MTPLTPGSDPSAPSARPSERAIRWGQIATGAAAILVIALLGWVLGQSQNVLWGEIPRYLVDPRILSGVVLTLELTVGGDGLRHRRRWRCSPRWRRATTSC